MANDLTQDNRQIAIETGLGKDKLLLKSLSLTEELGHPFVCQCEVRAADPQLDYSKLIGEPVAMRVNLPGGKTRFINGVVSKMGHADEPRPGRLNKYRLTVVPSLWFLTRAADCRIFQNKSIPDILLDVLKGYGVTNVEKKLKATYSPREYVVQYRETAFNFISRLMEEEGIFYFFDHTKDKHTLVLADDTSAHKPFPGFEKVQYKEQEKNTVGDARLWSVLTDRSARPGAYELVDYDFKAPTKLLLSTAKTLTQKQKAGKFEVFDYPGSFYTKGDGDRFAKVRMEESDAMHEILSMQGDVRGLSAGVKFTLEGSPIAPLNREYVVVSTHFTAQTDEYGSDNAASNAGTDEMVHFSCTSIPADVFYRPQRRTHKPSIAGPQTAFVTGPSGEEIHVDSFGRVKVKFLWDRHGTADDKSSCWVRVSQGWAGKKWGMMFIPRIGQEVIVEFLEGDPDRPIITGRVYNGGADGQIPYPLPDSKTVSTIKTSSSKGGAGFNEIRFEDKKGDEFVFIHAEKDLHIRVKNDRLEFIGHDRDLVVTNDKREHVKNDRSETIDRDHKEEIKRDRMLAVKGKEAVEITGSKSLTVKDDVIEDFKKNQSTKIAKDLYIKATNICIEATTNITIKVGESHIAIESDGIKIGTNGEIKVESLKDTTFESKTGKWGVKSLQDISFKSSAGNFKAEATINAEIKGTVGAKLEGKMTDVKGAMTTLSGDAMTTVKGGIVMIN